MYALLLSSAVAFAAWTVTDQAEDCTYFRGEVESSGATPVRVDPDVANRFASSGREAVVDLSRQAAALVAST